MGVKAKTFGKQNILLAVLAIGGVLLFQNVKNNKTFNTEQQGKNYVYELLSDNELVFTKHAKCRMECRTISKAEVEDILKRGEVNWRKSETEPREKHHCPSYALEGDTNDGQRVRIIFGDCENATKVITAIDLGKEYDCVCE